MKKNTKASEVVQKLLDSRPLLGIPKFRKSQTLFYRRGLQENLIFATFDDFQRNFESKLVNKSETVISEWNAPLLASCSVFFRNTPVSGVR